MQLGLVDHALAALVDRLAELFPAVGLDRIKHDIAETRAKFEYVAIHDFVPVLISRQLVEGYRQLVRR